MPSYPVLNVVITGIIYIFVAHETNMITKKLSKFAIPSDNRTLIRNICIFIAILFCLNHFF